MFKTKSAISHGKRRFFMLSLLTFIFVGQGATESLQPRSFHRESPE
jgi:hypothetical protein